MTMLSQRDAGRRLGTLSSRMAELDKEGAFPAYRDSPGRRLLDSDLAEEYARLRAAQARQRLNEMSPEEVA